MYNRYGQHDPDFGEWCSPNEMQRWVRASLYKTNGSNTVVRFQTAMIYSIAVLEERDFDSIGREIPKGTGVDSTLADGTKAPKRKKGNSKKKERQRVKGKIGRSCLFWSKETKTTLS
jgi:hypothetical protein